MTFPLHLLKGRETGGPVSFGSFWPRGEIRECCFRAVSGEREIPLQSAPAAIWPDGSVKWVRHTVDSGKTGGEVTVLPGCQNAAEPETIETVQTPEGISVRAGRLSAFVPGAGSDTLLKDVCFHGVPRISALRPVFLLERRDGDDEAASIRVIKGRPRVDEIKIEETGPVALKLVFRGILCADEDVMRFEIRLTLGDSEMIPVTYTFIFHGEEDRDRMKGMGLRVWAPLDGENYNHHVQMQMDGLRFHEPVILLQSRIPRTGDDMIREQLEGKSVYREGDAGKLLQEVSKALPVWNGFTMSQLSDRSCEIRKRTRPSHCWVPACHGTRGDGVMAVTGEHGGVLMGIRNFWQRYPSALQAEGAGDHMAELTAWFWSPEAEAMDFRHYDDRSYLSNYEGFDYFGASAEGISVTSEALICLTDQMPDEDSLKQFAKRVQKPPVYTASPETYHALHAFGDWSLPGADHPVARKLEKAMESAVAFYLRQQEERGWYGLFDYGDVRHAYDALRHTWKYDVGGYAWQNTELVPTYWLWLYFLRTGREDVFTMAENMSRHASEVDSYHEGPYKGVGSRHNVRHWGCPCKEPRVSMAGHHRPFLYLLGDLRMRSCLRDTYHAHESLCHVTWYRHTGNLCIRTAPDWSSLLSNWMCAYEETGDETYRQLVLHGIQGILKAPMGFGSGPLFDFDPVTGDMRYRGESHGNVHLTQCFATLQIMLEASDAMDLPELRDMCHSYGKIYMMTPQEREAAYGDLVQGKGYGMRYTASGMGACAGLALHEPELIRRAWHELLLASPMRYGSWNFAPAVYAKGTDGKEHTELTWISTNYVSQWCLNAIMMLAFGLEEIPGEEEADAICREAYKLEL